MDASPGLLCYCRPGFEPELAAELTLRAGEAALNGYARTERGSGYVTFLGGEGRQLARAIAFESLIFARQKLVLLADLAGLDPSDRVSPMLAALEAAGAPVFGDLVVEHPESDAAKPLAGLARSFGNALRPALRKAFRLSPKPDPTKLVLHVCFLAGDHALLAASKPGDASPWPLGIPRLRQHADAPSRSALKLEEALMTFFSSEEREQLLAPGMLAADLGAAPGGWSWVLAREGLRVSAIDNGPLSPVAHATGLIEHVRADGFKWSPPRGLDWMVCDMVEQPVRVAARMAEWFANGWCRHAIFNLKLPMKKRFDEVEACLTLFGDQAGPKPRSVRAKHLYHDREEVTVCVVSLKRDGSPLVSW